MPLIKPGADVEGRKRKRNETFARRPTAGKGFEPTVNLSSGRLAATGALIDAGASLEGITCSRTIPKVLAQP